MLEMNPFSDISATINAALNSEAPAQATLLRSLCTVMNKHLGKCIHTHSVSIAWGNGSFGQIGDSKLGQVRIKQKGFEMELFSSSEYESNSQRHQQKFRVKVKQYMRSLRNYNLRSLSELCKDAPSPAFWVFGHPLIKSPTNKHYSSTFRALVENASIGQPDSLDEILNSYRHLMEQRYLKGSLSSFANGNLYYIPHYEGINSNNKADFAFQVIFAVKYSEQPGESEVQLFQKMANFFVNLLASSLVSEHVRQESASSAARIIESQGLTHNLGYIAYRGLNNLNIGKLAARLEYYNKRVAFQSHKPWPDSSKATQKLLPWSLVSDRINYYSDIFAELFWSSIDEFIPFRIQVMSLCDSIQVRGGHAGVSLVFSAIENLCRNMGKHTRSEVFTDTGIAGIDINHVSVLSDQEYGEIELTCFPQTFDNLQAIVNGFECLKLYDEFGPITSRRGFVELILTSLDLMKKPTSLFAKHETSVTFVGNNQYAVFLGTLRVLTVEWNSHYAHLEVPAIIYRLPCKSYQAVMDDADVQRCIVQNQFPSSSDFYCVNERYAKFVSENVPFARIVKGDGHSGAKMALNKAFQIWTSKDTNPLPPTILYVPDSVIKDPVSLDVPDVAILPYKSASELLETALPSGTHCIALLHHSVSKPLFTELVSKGFFVDAWKDWNPIRDLVNDLLSKFGRDLSGVDHLRYSLFEFVWASQCRILVIDETFWNSGRDLKPQTPQSELFRSSSVRCWQAQNVSIPDIRGVNPLSWPPPDSFDIVCIHDGRFKKSELQKDVESFISKCHDAGKLVVIHSDGDVFAAAELYNNYILVKGDLWGALAKGNKTELVELILGCRRKIFKGDI